MDVAMQVFGYGNVAYFSTLCVLMLNAALAWLSFVYLGGPGAGKQLLFAPVMDLNWREADAQDRLHSDFVVQCEGAAVWTSRARGAPARQPRW